MKGSPGYPLCLQWQTNAEVLLPPPSGLGVENLIVLVQNRIQNLRTKPYDDLDCSDPIRWFIKQEPHTSEKAAQKRWRLIWSVSLVDQLIDRLLWSNMLQTDIKVWDQIPTKSGYSGKYGTTNRLYRKLDDGGKCAKGDKSSWDITVTDWLLDDNLDLNFRLCTNYDPLADWVSIAMKRHEATFHGYRVTSDGTLYRQEIKACMPSGFLLTLLYNSRMQVMLKCIAILEKTKRQFDWKLDMINAVGDDSLERLRTITKQDYLDCVNGYGFIFNDFAEGNLLDLEFCSRKFVKTAEGNVVTIPVNWGKNMAALRMREKWKINDVTDALVSLCIEYAYDNPHFQLLHSNLVEMAPHKAVSQRTCQYFVSGNESMCASTELAVIKRIQPLLITRNTR